MINLLKVSALCFALLALPCADTQAGEQLSSSVEVYVDQPVAEEGVMPGGMIWNQPLKAGDMVLQRKSQPRRATVDTVAPKAPVLPIGELKAPRLAPGNPATPPLVDSDKSSTASIMLLQGMKSALQQAGQNPDIPKSSLEPETAPKTEGPVSILPLDEVSADKQESVVVVKKESAPGVVYQPGQEPRSFIIPRLDDTAKEEGSASGILPSETVEKQNDSIADVVKAFDEETSIFGAPVAETEKTSDAFSCVPQVTKWSRSCAEAGYPERFSGGIIGETRIECPSGEKRDVWLSNSCAEQVGKMEGAAPQEESVSVVMPQDSGPLDASCGTANGLAVSVAPVSGLCVRGESTPVTGEGPWRWNCLGRAGGVTVSCAAPVSGQNGTASRQNGTGGEAALPSAQDGKCGESHGASAEQAPTSGLCEKGSASRVNGSGPWTWACSGLDGGKAAACEALKKIDGDCGAAGRDGVDSMPTRDLCAAGYASAVTGEGPWNWTCSGLHGGEAATCRAVPRVNAVCGQASMVGHRDAPEKNLCSVGTASKIAGKGPWSWSCEGSRGGATVSCEAPVLTDGKCGSANGSQYAKAPETGLCAQGTPSRVSGLGPWNWTCSGSQGGATESCTAILGSEESVKSVVRCGTASQVIALSKPKDKLCEDGEASEVSGEGPWNWTCSDNAGHSTACTTLKEAAGVCGAAADTPATNAPVVGLCKEGTPTEVNSDPKKKTWSWSCRGFMGGATVVCAAPLSEKAREKIEEKLEKGQCGESAGQSFTEAPAQDLCKVGTPSPVRGAGPWSWTCSGKKGPNVVCEASMRSNGACGSANGSIQREAPESGLCQSGKATEVRGKGPWMWSCVGEGGGASVSCSAASQAQARVDGTCGAASNAVMTVAPVANLCDTGSASAVYGEGPWTWTCSGTNGGIASTCTTSKVMPKAPLPPGPRVNGLCGPSNGVAFNEAPTDGLCSTGTLSSISGQGPWNWSCLGENGGMTVSCTAPLTPPSPIEGVCGASSGVPSLTAPKGSLCSSGIASAVSGKGPWTWSCSGTDGGGAVSCVAPKAGGSSRGVPSLVTPSTEAPAPDASPVGLVTPQLPAGPLPPLDSGKVPNLKSSKTLVPPSPDSAKVSSGKDFLVPKSKKDKVVPHVPQYAPSLPEDSSPLETPGTKPLSGVNPPVLDSVGKPVPNARLSLKSDVSVISFENGSDQLDKDAVATVEKLAAILKAHQGSRITLVAYSSVDGKIDPREARRISLNRALSVRDFLSAKGITSDRIDVRPMGGNVPSGDMDRVDVVVN